MSNRTLSLLVVSAVTAAFGSLNIAPANAQGEHVSKQEMMATAGHVHVSAVANGGGAEDQILVTVAVDPGYHINANPASFDYLIPTSVQFPALHPLHVRYPGATRFKAEFAPAGLDVYEGSVQLRATFPPHTLGTAGAVQGVVTAQACDLKVCLPPSKIAFSVKVRAP